MAKFAVLADTHAGCRADNPIFDASARKFFTEQFFPYLDAHKIKQVLHLGDVFDKRTSINFQTLKSFREYFLIPVQERELEIKIIPGNHDVFHKNTNELNSLDLLLEPYDEYIEVLHDPREIILGGESFATVPWICNENEAACEAFIKKTKAKICFGHFEIEGFEMFRGIEHHGGMNIKIFKKFEAVYSGHFHHKSSDKNIHYLGTTYEQCWSDFDDPKGFHIFDTKTREMTFVENPDTKHVKIYYDDSKSIPNPQDYTNKIVKMIVSTKTDVAKYDTFIDKLYECGIAELKIIEDMRSFEEDAVQDTIVVDDIRTMLEHYVDEIEMTENTDRSVLKSLLKELYVEAQNDQI